MYPLWFAILTNWNIDRVKEIYEIIGRLNQEQKVTMLLVEQNANMALQTAKYGYVLEIGRSSVHIVVEVWINSQHDGEPIKVTEGEFVFVAIDENGRTRAIKR